MHQKGDWVKADHVEITGLFGVRASVTAEGQIFEGFWYLGMMPGLEIHPYVDATLDGVAVKIWFEKSHLPKAD